MSIVLGIDIGGSATKIAGLRADGTVLSMLRVQAEDQVTSLYGALGKYLTQNGLQLSDIAKIALTGVGAGFVEGDVLGIPTCKVDEFAASCTGALTFSGEKEGIVVTMGTGTAFLWAEANGTLRHLCGSGIGGGTLSGLCRKMLGTDSIQQIQCLFPQGELSKVDLSVGDIAPNPAATLDPTLTASNFGKLSDEASEADLAAGIVNLVLQAIGTMTVFATQCCNHRTVILTGSMTAIAKANFENFERLYGIHYIIPENAAFATAVGAALEGMK